LSVDVAAFAGNAVAEFFKHPDGIALAYAGKPRQGMVGAKPLGGKAEGRMKNAEWPGKATQSHLKATPKRIDSQGIATPEPP
jgi:hypothetical protein